MSSQGEQWYRDNTPYTDGRGHCIDTPDDAVVSMGDDDGAYVQVWVWVPDPKGAGGGEADDSEVNEDACEPTASASAGHCNGEPFNDFSSSWLGN